nr:hypothetical protein HmN_000244000 [Hymenolepis microstoma]
MLRLKKRLADERKLKKITTHKVDDLLSPYEELLRRINVPYTPQHNLEHRRKLEMITHLQRKLAHEILEEQTLERKQEQLQRNSSK